MFCKTCNQEIKDESKVYEPMVVPDFMPSDPSKPMMVELCFDPKWNCVDKIRWKAGMIQSTSDIRLQIEAGITHPKSYTMVSTCDCESMCHEKWFRLSSHGLQSDPLSFKDMNIFMSGMSFGTFTNELAIQGKR